MIKKNETTLRFNRPAVFRPAYTRRVVEQGAPITRQSLSDFEDTNFDSTASFRYDPVGTGLKSTQQLNVDYSLFANHTFFNSAEVKVNVAFEEIINKYPYDGTRREVEAFLDGLTGFEHWVYEQFPKNVGYLKFQSGSFIEVVDHAGAQLPAISRTQSGRSALDPGTDSITFEMQLHVPPVANDNQVILQKLSGSQHGFTLGLLGTGSLDDVDVFLSFVSASDALTLTGTISKGNLFTHLVGTYDRRENVNKLFLYANEQMIASSSTSLDMGQIDFTLSPMYIGSGSAMITGATGATYTPTETLSGALDELRVFHDVRTLRQQKKYANRNIFAEPTLKLYFKFNEPAGTIGTGVGDSINRIVLDHSGNSLTSFIDSTNFTFDLRSTGSIRPPLKYEVARYNPVLFSTYSPIVDFNRELLASASDYDENNPNLITKLVPQHYFLEGQSYEALSNVTGTVANEIIGSGVPGEAELGQPQLLLALLYVASKELDEVKLFLEQFGNSLFVDYNDFDTTPDQLLAFLANYRGFDLPGLFNNATFEQFSNAQDIEPEFSTSELSLQQVQNEIWRRLLSNLNEILRSKGTVHSIKAFIRTLGIDPDQNFRIREYGGPKRGRLGDSREDRAEVSTMLDMNSTGSFLTSSLLQATSRIEPGYPSPAGTANDVLLTSGSWTYEARYRWPLTQTKISSQSLARLTVSGTSAPAPVFNLIAASGTVPVSSSVSVFGKPASGTTGNTLNLRVSGVNIMDGRMWYVAFGRNRNDDPLLEDATNVSSSYFLRVYRQENGELYESYTTASYFMESIDNDGTIDAQRTEPTFISLGSQSIEAAGYLTNTEHIVTDFDGKIGHIRFWSRGLTEPETREHALNYKSVGVIDPRVNFNFVDELTGSWGRLRADFSTDQYVTGTTADGGLRLFDFSQNEYYMTGSNFPVNTAVILPETFRYSIISPKYDEATTNNKIRVRSFQQFENVQKYPGSSVAPVYETPAPEVPEDDPRFAIDFSVVDALNEDIINIFATLASIDDALGSGNTLFTEDYPDLQGLRDVYFQRLTGKVNLKSFFEFFRWFDTSIGMFIEQLIPRKTRFLGTNFVVESHMLERPKFQHKYEDVYLGENVRNAAKGVILLQLITGRMKRY